VKAVVVMVPAPQEEGAGITASLRDVVAAARAVPGAIVRVAAASGSNGVALTECGVVPAHVIETRGDTSGDRHRFAIADLFRRGAKQVVLVDGSQRNLTSALVQEALASLDTNPQQVVLGPASDGRYYLLGLTGPKVPDLFSGVRWGTKYTLMDTLRRCEFEERRVTFLDLLDA
jgi:glycosyltransferase A (GT-A) superfamily protein (DUF2064 family)